MIAEEKKKSKPRHVDLIAEHLETYGSITTWEAIERYGCTRLSARISDLRGLGWEISTAMETGRNRFGHTSNYARYTLEARP